ncbi:2OG-Fe(II) oxygenase superfamily [Musa troglodytarum]|uniref:2OG-Fe(II) oxygenase superfamily n=1 Tax=Musa troglodytarum TaxID=320322 RepID=A0A9E7FUY3_9LILI|nr:2OG-Fe(II) oxygenase superfamily [Musa troglodytarum]
MARVPDTLRVHIGYHLEVTSDGKYKRLVHRAVLNSQKIVTAASELIDGQHHKRYTESSFEDFLDFMSSTSKTA